MRKVIYLAGGCFWGCEKYFALLPGVVETEVGYANGFVQNPSYEQVCGQNTGHAETVKVCYDSPTMSLPFLLSCYYEVVDPTSVNRQGNDIGAQYRTGIYFTEEEDEPIIKASLQRLQKKYKQPIAIECTRLLNFYAAEEYHQRYLDKNPAGYCHIGPDLFEKASKAKKPKGE